MISTNSIHPVNASSSILTTLCGIVTVEIATNESPFAPIESNALDNLTFLTYFKSLVFSTGLSAIPTTGKLLYKSGMIIFFESFTNPFT